MQEMSDVMLWQPTVEALRATALYQFAEEEGFASDGVLDYPALHAWSIDDLAGFWNKVWDFGGLVGDKGDEVFRSGDHITDARFFPDAKLNFAENMLRFEGPEDAIVASGEGKAREVWSRDELKAAALKFAAWLTGQGIGKGDRVAGIVANIPEAAIAMLGTAAIGAVWSSCSPDFGEAGMLDRFGQINPRILVVIDGYTYAQKKLDVRQKVMGVSAGLASVEEVVMISYRDLERPAGITDWADIMAAPAPEAFTFERFSARDPLYIMFSSGTTGKPKCIVHSIGGTLLQHVKELRLHCDIADGTRMMYFTTCGWMMWNWQVSGLAVGATLILFDGTPFAEHGKALFRIAEEEKLNFLGVSAKFIDGLKNEKFRAEGKFDLSNLRTFASTGSPLVPECFSYVYDNIKRDINLASIAGGTDLLSCFILGNPCGPVWKGEIQVPGLGMAVEVWDEEGKRVAEHEGELVCTRPFPSMPVGFLNDPDDARYRAAYFERFDNVWTHGDFIIQTSHGGYVMLGRSDATLNPQGVRIGTAEIYAQVEGMERVAEAIAVGQQWQGDVRIVLFVVPAEGVVLDHNLTEDIRARIRHGASPRHVPAKIIAVPDIPRTKSGKITELAVRDVIHGREVRNTQALDNPEALEHYRDRPELET
jgi:acetoacetyl-CoA synthetase